MATSAITPNESLLPEEELAAPNANESTKVEVNGPDATPPESKAMPVKSSGQKSIRSIEII